ncbi:hypothetical protein MKX01_006630 [Papaver californicum]|nr:hypothetical protein MKX01_006630 [Papaver californicum]
MEELFFNNRITAKEALQLLLNTDNKGIKFTIKATMVDIVDGSTWFYMACPNCNKRHVWHDGKPWCHSCEKKIRNPIARYRLELKVRDHTDTAPIIVLGPTAEPLLGNVRISKFMEINALNIEV